MLSQEDVVETIGSVQVVSNEAFTVQQMFSSVTRLAFGVRRLFYNDV
jgi:hypothetical protein